MAEFLQVLRCTVERHGMFSPGETVVVGVSGGADSVSLLSGLLALSDSFRLTVAAAHVNHQLRDKDADEDEAFVKKWCREWDVPLTVFRVDVRALAKAEGLSLEESGRRLRYESLYGALKEHNAQKIAVAHNRDDNVETVLFNLCRGAGLKGLCGIPPVNGVIVRPLIAMPRHLIEAYLTGQGLPFRTDTSNFTDHYTRNRIRRHIMPALAKHINDSVASVIARNTLYLREEEELLEALSEDAFRRCEVKKDKPEAVWLDADRLDKLPNALKRRVIRIGLARVNNGSGLKDINSEHIERALDIALGSTGRFADLPRSFRVEKVYGHVKLYLDAAEESGLFCFRLEPEQPVYLPALGKSVCLSLEKPREANGLYTKVFCYDKINESLVLRTRRPGDRIALANVNGMKKIQDYFTDQKIPRGERDRIVLLADGNDILWILPPVNRVNISYTAEPGHRLCWLTVTGKQAEEQQNNEKEGFLS